MSSWWVGNAIFAQLPLLVDRLPEGRALGTQLSMMAQAGQKSSLNEGLRVSEAIYYVCKEALETIKPFDPTFCSMHLGNASRNVLATSRGLQETALSIWQVRRRARQHLFH